MVVHHCNTKKLNLGRTKETLILSVMYELYSDSAAVVQVSTQFVGVEIR